MSTNYYLINKKDKQIKNKLDKLIDKEIQKLQNKLLKFTNTYDLDLEEEIEDKFRTISNTLEYGVFEPKEIHICRTSFKLTWQVNEYYKNLDEFIEFYNKNKDKYYIEDEYSERFTLNQFIKKITWDRQEIRYESRDFS